MTALIVIGCILLFFAILLLSPVILRFAYQGEKVSAKLQYLFLVIDFSPEKVAKRAEKKAKKAVKQEYKKQKTEEPEEPPIKKKERAALDTVKTVWSYVKASQRAWDILRKHVVFCKIKATVIVGGGDAAKIAQDYATYCTAAANGLSALDTLFAVREPDIFIQPDFVREQTVHDLKFQVRISPLYPVWAGISALLGILKVMRQNKQKREKTKGGKKHERNKRSKRTNKREHAASYQ